MVIIGAARQGLALARYLLEHGAEVVITDLKPFEALEPARQTLVDVPGAAERLSWVCGGHPFSLLEGATLLCPSGGVPLTLPLIEEADSEDLSHCPMTVRSFWRPFHAKSSASPARLVKPLLLPWSDGWVRLLWICPDGQSPYRQVWVGGNIGSPLIAEVDRMQPDDLVVMELSSFQLEIMTRSPQVAAILNITPNHLDRHDTMEAYTAAKARILAYQSPLEVAVLGRDDPGAWSLAGQAKGQLFSFGFTPLPAKACGTFLYEDDICVCTDPGKRQATWVMKRAEVALRGEHNLLNVMAACTVAAAAGLPVEAMRAGVKGFTGVPHRLEFVRSWGGADWYNNSIATAPERTMAGIRSFQEPLILLAGGRDKKLPWDEFARLVSQRVDHLIVFGEAADIILQAVQPEQAAGLKVTRCKGLREAVDCAAQVVKPGMVVLLSPGGTSFDEFQDFEERGVCFARWVRELP